MAKRRSRGTRRNKHSQIERLEPRIAPANFNVNSVGGLIAAIQTADSNSDSINTITLAAGTYTLKGSTAAEIKIEDQPGAARTLIIKGNTEANTLITGGTDWQDRIFEIDGNDNLTVSFQNLSISGGNVVGSNPTIAAHGGGLLIDNGNVALSHVNVFNNAVAGANGLAGLAGLSGQKGSDGGRGGDAEGAGIYLADGTLTLNNASIDSNSARGGKGGVGGHGGNQVTSYAKSSANHGLGSHAASPLAGSNGVTGHSGASPGAAGGPGGKGGDGADGTPIANPHNAAGGDGGDGGDARGGGVFVAGGQLSISSSDISGNSALGGKGGSGGSAGAHVSMRSGGFVVVNKGLGGFRGGQGGRGGSGANGLSNPGGVGGKGGDGGIGGDAGAGGDGGDAIDGGDGSGGGDGGLGEGGGVYIADGIVIGIAANVSNNLAVGGTGGNAGAAGFGGAGGRGARGGNVTLAYGGRGGNGGIFSGSGGNGGKQGDAGAGGGGGGGGGGGEGGDGGGGGAGHGGGFYVADGSLTLVESQLTGNSALGGNGAFGGAGVAGAVGGAGGGGGLAGTVSGIGRGGRGGTGAGGVGGAGADGNGADGGQGGAGGDGGDGGEGGKGGDGGDGGDGQGGSLYIAGGSVTLVKSTSASRARGASGGGGGNGGRGGAGGTGASGGHGGGGGFGLKGGDGGDGGAGGEGGEGGVGGDAGHASNGGDGQGGDAYVAAAGTLTLSNNDTFSGTVTGGNAGSAGAVGAGGAAGLAGKGGPAGGAGMSPTNGTDGAAGKTGEDGHDGNEGGRGALVGPGSAGSADGANIFGGTSSVTQGPVTTLQAANIDNSNASSSNPYTFTIAYSDPLLIDASTVSGAIVQVQPPSGPALTATATKTTLSGLQDGSGNAQTITVTYQITPPGGNWTSAPGGTYTISLVSSPPQDLAGKAAATGSLGSFSNSASSSSNAAPTINVTPPSQSAQAGGAPIALNGLSVVNNDQPPGTGTLTVVVSSETGIALTTTVTQGVSGKGTNSLTVTGTQAHVNSALAALTFQADASIPTGAVSVSVTATESVDHDSSNKSFDVQVQGQSQGAAPSISNLTAAQNYTLGGTLLVGSGATVTDAGAANFSGGQLTVSITANADTHDQLTLANQGSGAGKISLSGGSVYFGSTLIGKLSGGTAGSPLVVSFTSKAATPTVAQAIVRDVQFKDTAVGASTLPRTIEFEISDGRPQSSPPAAVTVNVTAPHAPPVVKLHTTGISFSIQAPPVQLAPAATLTDSSLTSFAGGTLTVALSKNGTADDNLEVLNQGNISVSGTNVDYGTDLIGTISGWTAGSPLVISLTSNATIAATQALIQAIGFENGSANPSTKVRTVRFELDDGAGGTSKFVTEKVHVVVPAITIDPASSSITYTIGNAPVTLLGNATITDRATATYGGSRLVISSSQARDQLTIQNTGGIVVNSNTITYNGKAIGTHVGNTVHFTAGATQAGVQAVLRSFAFASTGPTRVHTVTFQFTDSLGKTGHSTVSVSVL